MSPTSHHVPRSLLQVDHLTMRFGGLVADQRPLLRGARAATSPR